jgi:hypothetical protein
MNDDINQDETILTAPYNTLNLPEGKQPNLSNPRQSHRVPLGTENKSYDPTKKMVDDYLKTNMSMYDNKGKYFDTYLFNQKFDQYINEKTDERKLKEQVKLYDLDNIENIQIQPYELPLNKLLINFKNLWFELFDNLINYKNPSYLFTTTNFFYFGTTLVVIFLLYIMLSYIFQ